MLLRVIIENILSFKEPTEFNTFPGSIKNKSYHKQSAKKVEWLKASAIYGANGAGKSNIVRVLEFLRDTIKAGEIEYIIEPFRLDGEYYDNKPSKIDIEFHYKNTFFYYEISFKNDIILKEVLWKDSNEEKPSKIFERTYPKKNEIKIDIDPHYIKSEKDKLRISILEEDVITPSETAISNTILRKSIKDIESAYTWLHSGIVIITPYSEFKGIVDRSLYENEFFEYLKSTLSVLDTGIADVHIKESTLESFFGEDEKSEIERIKKDLDKDPKIFVRIETDIGDVVVRKMDDKYIVNHLQFFHKGGADQTQSMHPFELIDESDGTQRLLDLIPMTYSLLAHDLTFVVDEIERSIHPVLIKEMLSKLLEAKFKGQLIFTTHESSLLDLDIFRQDEIWLTEKNAGGETKMYPLSDFKPRFDLDIRKSYLNGRFGAIPFLGNLKELKWDKVYEEK